jgi:hypothetical protein
MEDKELELGDVLETYRNYLLVRKCPSVAWWFNDFIICEDEARLDLLETTESVQYCNWAHYVATEGWIG